MSSPFEIDYWKNVQERWSKSVDDANHGLADASVTAREQLISFVPAERIVVSGTRGAGKSVIYNAFLGPNGKRYKKEESKRVEGRRVKIRRLGNKVRANWAVLPGQRDSRTRLKAVGRIFTQGRYPVGVIHVVNWGFAEVWDRDARPGILNRAVSAGKSPDLAGVCEYLRTVQELEDFELTSDLLKDSWAGRTDEVWFIIAVTKCDLYWPQIAQVQEYYIPGDDPELDSPFAKDLRLLIKQLKFPKFAVLPISCVSDPFDFSGALWAGSGKFNDNWSAALIRNMLDTIGKFDARNEA
jgi:hypothetical protein